MKINNYKIGHNVALALTMCLLLSSQKVYSAPLSEKLLSVEWGSAPGAVGYDKRSKVGVDEGPASFYVSTEGAIYILDSVNHRVNKYLDGKYADSIQIKSRYKPYDLLLEHGVLFVLTGYSLEAYDTDGKRIALKKLTDDKSKILHGVWRLFKVDDGFIITTKPGRANGNIICLKSDLNYGSCGKWSKLFDKYEVYDKVDNNFVINDVTKTVWIDEAENAIKSITPIDLGRYDQLFPVVVWYRFKGNYLYTMKASEKGVIVSRINIDNLTKNE